jgi:hypothetical protein
MPLIWPDPIEDEYGTMYNYFAAAGASVHDCAIIAQRYDAQDGFHWDQSESWLVRIRPSGVADPPDVKKLVLGGTEWLTRVWMSPAGKFWCSSMNGDVYEENADGSGYQTHQLPANISGVWGLDDRCVLAWSEAMQRLYRWDGSRWRELPCPGRVLCVAGTAPDDLLASGYGGLIWRWNGQDWTDISITFEGSVPGLHVESADLAYACTTGGDIAEITRFGAQRLAAWPGALLDVTRLGDNVVVAWTDSVLHVPVGTNAPASIPTGLFPSRFHRHGDTLLIAAGRGVAQTRDGETIDDTTSADFVREIREQEVPLWMV